MFRNTDISRGNIEKCRLLRPDIRECRNFEVEGAGRKTVVKESSREPERTTLEAVYDASLFFR